MAIDSYDKWVIKMSFSTCRFCDSCGGNYPTYAGEGVKDKSQGRYSKYHDDCGGSKLYDDNNNANPQLCCSFDQPPVQYCLSCGSDYKSILGERVNNGDREEYKTKSDACEGYKDGDQFKQSDKRFYVCGKNKR